MDEKLVEFQMHKVTHQMMRHARERVELWGEKYLTDAKLIAQLWAEMTLIRQYGPDPGAEARTVDPWPDRRRGVQARIEAMEVGQELRLQGSSTPTAANRAGRKLGRVYRTQRVDLTSMDPSQWRYRVYREK